MEKRKIAITDIDGTHFRSSLMDILIEELIKREIFPSAVGEEYFAAQEVWKNREHGNAFTHFQEKGIAIIIENLKGKDKNLIHTVTDEIVEKYMYRTYVFTRWLYSVLKNKGYTVGAISQSPDFIVKRFAKLMEFEFDYGTQYHIDNATGLFNGEITLHQKNDTITKLLSDNPSYHMKGSFAIGDTAGDIPMLRLVDYPIAFNPNEELYIEAEINGWPIVLESRDVVYLHGKRFDWQNLELADFMNLAYK